VDNRIPGVNLCHVPIGLYLEGEPVRLANQRHHLVEFNHYWLLCNYQPSRRTRSENQIVGIGLPSPGSSGIRSGMNMMIREIGICQLRGERQRICPRFSCHSEA
jgi:hypothetical protein